MGTMPFHLEKGVLGLRFDYLTRDADVRDHVLARLQSGKNPFLVAGSINVRGVGINALTDKRAVFAKRLDDLFATDSTLLAPGERRTGAEYLEDDALLMERNRDSTGNRTAFLQYWIDGGVENANLIDEVRQAIIKALVSGRTRIDYWWNCTEDDTPPTAVCSLDVPGVARVYFCTDHNPVEHPPTLPARAPLDP